MNRLQTDRLEIVDVGLLTRISPGNRHKHLHGSENLKPHMV